MTTNTTVRPPPSETSGSDFARLSRKIADAGLLGRRPGYYAVRITVVAALYVAGWAAVALIGDSWWTLTVAGFLAVIFGQVALLAHDAAHRQVFRRRRASEVSGRIAGVGIGMGYGWWQDKHTQRALAATSHLIISPMVLAELDYLISTRAGAQKALIAARFIERNVATRRFEVPSVSTHLSAAIAVAEGYADGGKGIGLTDAMNVALAAAYRTDALLTSDRHFRMVRPLTGHPAFRLLPEDL